jgi:hypothetical protein
MPSSQVQADSKIEDRRSPRVLARIPVSLTASQGSSVNALTAVINRHGALILSAMPYDEGMILTIQNELTMDSTSCRVVWVGDLDPSDAYKIGVEFVDEVPSFWGSVYEERAALANTPPSPPVAPTRPR